MRRRISVGERLVADMVEEEWDNLDGNDDGVDALFGALGVAGCERAGQGSLVVFTSAVDYQAAHKIAKELVSQRKAAFVNILPKVSSIFWRGGEVEECDQSFLVVNTTAYLFQDVVNIVQSTNGYRAPEIIALPVVNGSVDHLERVNKKKERRTEVKITVGSIELDAWLNGTDTAARVIQALPMTSKVSLWGDEVYFPVQVERGLGDGKADIVKVGDIAYWPPGKAISIFLGSTPLSRGGEIRPLTAVEVIGRIEAPEALLGRVRQGEKITIWR